jgi:DNA-binding protein HU-beta
MIKKENKKMNKAELITAVSEKMGSTKKDAGIALEAVVAAITDAVAEGNEVNITGFGKFSVAERPEREGRNPATGETIKIAASKSPKFKASKTLKDAVNA